MSLVKTIFCLPKIKPAMRVEDLLEKLKLADPKAEVFIEGVWCNSPFIVDYDVKINSDGDVIFDTGGFLHDILEENENE